MKLSVIKKIMPILLVVTFFLISLGGAVRAMHAGLACPDWPLCFGDVIPDFQVQVYYEFIHRTIAGIVALATGFVAFVIYKSKQSSRELKITMSIALTVLISQIILGGLTVLKLLHFGVVTAHLAFGVGFWCCLLWIYFCLRNDPKSKAPLPRAFLGLSIFILLIIYGQILLGGLVSSNYAGLVCEDFPLCEGEFIPTFKGLVGLQVIHRLGAYFVTIAIISFYQVVSKNRESAWMDERYFYLSRALVLTVILQIGVGVANVMYKTPPLITVVHLALATTLLGIILRLIYLGRHFSK